MVVAGTGVGLLLGEPVKAKEVLVEGSVSILLDCAREAYLKEIVANVLVPLQTSLSQKRCHCRCNSCLNP